MHISRQDLPRAYTVSWPADLPRTTWPQLPPAGGLTLIRGNISVGGTNHPAAYSIFQLLSFPSRQT